MTTDRYVSFAGIDCDGNSRRVIEVLLRHLENPTNRNAYWDAFQVKLREAAASRVAQETAVAETRDFLTVKGSTPDAGFNTPAPLTHALTGNRNDD